jgi:hypothetical protein
LIFSTLILSESKCFSLKFREGKYGRKKWGGEMELEMKIGNEKRIKTLAVNSNHE